MTREQASEFLDELFKRSSNGALDLCCYNLALFLLRSGIRIGEARALKWDDITIKGNKAEVSINKTAPKNAKSILDLKSYTKSVKPRTVYIPLETVDSAWKWVLSRGNPDGLLFSVDGRQTLGETTSQHKFNNAFKVRNIPFRSHHILCHTFATDYLLADGELHDLSKILGHSTIRMTEVYAKVTDKGASRGYEKYQRTLNVVVCDVLDFDKVSS